MKGAKEMAEVGNVSRVSRLLRWAHITRTPVAHVPVGIKVEGIGRAYHARGFEAVLLTGEDRSLLDSVLGPDGYRLNERQVLVGVEDEERMDKLLGAVGRRGLHLRYPNSVQQSLNLISDFLRDNGIDSFVTLEQYTAHGSTQARYYYFNVRTGCLACDGLGQYEAGELERFDMDRHGVVFVR